MTQTLTFAQTLRDILTRRKADREFTEAILEDIRREMTEAQEREGIWGHELGMLGHKIATEAVRRIIAGQALGTPSLYNIIRESAIDILGEG